MRKRYLLAALVLLLSVNLNAQTEKLDTAAVFILDRMSEMIGELKSCSATITSAYDVSNEEFGLVKHSDIEHVYISGPDKMLVRSEGDKGNRYLLYNGKTLSYYSQDHNQYSQVKVPGSIIEMIDYMNKNYGIIFPLADFLYPGFVDDILAEAHNLVLLGMTKVDGKDCFHIAGTAKDKTFQFWISDAPFYLPVKLVIVNTDKTLNPQFEAVYSDWQMNQDIPSTVFEFKAPPNSRKIKLSQLTVKK